MADGTVAVLGYGVAGRAAAEYVRTVWGVEPVVYVPTPQAERLRRENPAGVFRPDTEEITEETLIRSPGIRPDTPAILRAIGRGARLTGEAELFCGACPAPIYAVTGSDGKTTTATLAAEMLRTAGHTVYLGGNIGVSLLPSLPHIRPHDRVVLELSSFQLMTFQPVLAGAAVTNLTENHLDWHTGMEEYRHAKRNILPNAARRVQNARSQVAPEYASLLFSAGMQSAAYHMRDGALYHGETFLCRTDEVCLPGKYNLDNLLCAAALTDAPAEAVRTVARTFRGVPHRLEFVGEYRGVRCYNSSIDTTPARTAASLTAVHPPVTVICGGHNKNLSFRPLTAALLRHAARAVFTGACGEKMYESLLGDAAYGGTPAVCYTPAFGDAVRLALEMTPPGGTLLLSPAAASFDAFTSYTERGEAFRRILAETAPDA